MDNKIIIKNEKYNFDEKIILEIIDINNEILIKKYKSIMQISNEYPNIPYYNLRRMYLNEKKKLKNKTGQIKINKMIKNNFKIYDNPEYINMLIIS